MQNFFKDELKKVKAFAFDVDGVLSSQVFVHPTGELLRSMNTKDGFALQYAVKKGYPIAIITGGNSKSVGTRFRGLGITDIYLASANKEDDFDDFCMKYGIAEEQVLYMGDDLPDYLVMKRAGVATCPANAVEEIKSISAYISDKDGGTGCVRDVIEQVLRAQGKWLDTASWKW